MDYIDPRSGKTPLHQLATFSLNYFNAMRELAGDKTSPLIRDKSNWLPSTHAIANGNEDVYEILNKEEREAGAKIGIITWPEKDEHIHGQPPFWKPPEL